VGGVPLCEMSRRGSFRVQGSGGMAYGGAPTCKFASGRRAVRQDEIEPPGLGFVLWARNLDGRGCRGVESGGRRCQTVQRVRALMDSQGGGEGVHPKANRAAGARFCALRVKSQWEGVQGSWIWWETVSDGAGGARVDGFARGRRRCSPQVKSSHRGSLFDWGRLSPTGMGLGSPK
jgi:hypothetical protein